MIVRIFTCIGIIVSIILGIILGIALYTGISIFIEDAVNNYNYKKRLKLLKLRECGADRFY